MIIFFLSNLQNDDVSQSEDFSYFSEGCFQHNPLDQILEFPELNQNIPSN